MAEHREEFILALVSLRQFGEPDFEFALEFDAFGDVANEASGVEKLAAFPVAAGVDEDVPDRAVLASERGREVVNDLAAHQAVPEFVEALAVHEEIDELAADVFGCRVSEQS